MGLRAALGQPCDRRVRQQERGCDANGSVAVLEEGQDARHVVGWPAATLKLEGGGAHQGAGVAEQWRGAIGDFSRGEGAQVVERRCADDIGDVGVLGDFKECIGLGGWVGAGLREDGREFS